MQVNTIQLSFVSKTLPIYTSYNRFNCISMDARARLKHLQENVAVNCRMNYCVSVVTVNGTVQPWWQRVITSTSSWSTDDLPRPSTVGRRSRPSASPRGQRVVGPPQCVLAVVSCSRLGTDTVICSTCLLGIRSK